MSLPEWALRNPLLMATALLLVFVLGIESYWSMPRTEDPQFEFAAALVRVVKTGTRVEDMEALIVNPIEEALNEIDHIKHLKTNIQTGVASFEVEFIYGSDADDKYDEVVAAVESARSSLPDGLQLLEVDRVSPKDVSVMQIALSSSTLGLYQLRQHAETLEQLLERQPGIKQVDVSAAPMQQVLVAVDALKLYGSGLTGLELSQVLTQSADNQPLGFSYLNQERFNVTGSGDYQDLAAISSTFIHRNQAESMQLDQVAGVYLSDPEPSYRGFIDGKPGVWVSVMQREDTQISQVLGVVDQVLEDFKQTLPKALTLEVIHDQRISTHRRVSGFFYNLFQGLVLVFIATFVCLGFANASIVTALIPVSIAMALGWLDLLGFGIQQMSIVGLVIALGLLVDNALVVTESVNHRRMQGLPVERAAAIGTTTVAWPILAGTLTTVLAFVPLLALPNNSGTFMRSMPIMVVLTLLASLLCALCLAPLLISRFSYPAPPKLYGLMKSFAKTQYRPWLRHCLQFPKRYLLLAAVFWGASLSLFPLLGVSLFPKAEKHMVNVYLELPAGTGFNQTYQRAMEFAADLHQEPQVVSIAVNVGRENPRVYYNVFPGRQVPHYAHLLVFFDQSLSMDKVQAKVAELRKIYTDRPGLKVRIREFQQGPPTAAPIAIRLLSEDLDTLKTAASLVEAKMTSHPGVINLENPMSEYNLDLNAHIKRDKAAQWGVAVADIDETLKLATQGQVVGTYLDEQGDELPIVVRLDREWSLPERLHGLYVRVGANVRGGNDARGSHMSGDSGHSYPVSALVELRLEGALNRLQHYNQSRMARLTADVKEGFNIRQTTQEVLTAIEQLDLSGVQVMVGGDEASRQESFEGMSKALTFALVAVLSILIVQFRSLTQPVIILTATPFALTGALIGLWLIGSSFSFTAFIGLTALVGIVVNNAILLVDAANRKINKGCDVVEAILQAAEQRFVPILLTTLTTILGLLPLTLASSSLWTPMGTVIIGGLLCSTLLTLFVVPILYTCVGGYQAHVRHEAALTLPEEEAQER